jgi:predicted NBD/HSP70 family sugar kinase
MSVGTLGVHLAPGGVRTALVDPDGHVLAAANGSADLASIVFEAMAQAHDARAAGAVGLAVDALDTRDHASARQVLSSYGRVEVVPAGAAAVMAEAWVGAAKGLSHVVCLWIGEHVLAGLLIDGRPWTGAHGHAGAAGWLAINPVERQDYRRFGSFAAEVSTHGIARRLVWRIETGDDSAVLRQAGSLAAITAAHVFDAARQGDGVAVSIVRETARYIGMAAANLAVALDPEVVVIAGPVVSAGDLLIDPVRQESVRRLPPQMAHGFRCELSPLGDDGIAIGAARLAARSNS